MRYPRMPGLPRRLVPLHSPMSKGLKDAVRNAVTQECLDVKWPLVERFIRNGHADVLEPVRHLEAFGTGSGGPD